MEKRFCLSRSKLLIYAFCFSLIKFPTENEIAFHGVNAPIPEGSDEYMWNRALRTQPAAQDAEVQNTSRLNETAVLRSDKRRYEYSSPPEPIDHYRGDGRGRSSHLYSDTYGRRPYAYEGAGDGRPSPQGHSAGQSYYEDRIPGLSPPPPSRGSSYYNSPMQSEAYGDSPNWQYGEPARRSTTPNSHMAYSDVRQQPAMTPPGRTLIAQVHRSAQTPASLWSASR